MVQPVRYLGIKENIPHLLVEPDASLPSLAKNVWMYADPEGWKEHFGAEEDCLTPEMMQLFRKGIQALQKEHDTPEISLTLQDWRLEEETLPEEDSQAYQVSVTGTNITSTVKLLTRKVTPVLVSCSKSIRVCLPYTSTPAGICCSTFIAPITDSF